MQTALKLQQSTSEDKWKLVLTQPWGDIHNTGYQHTIEAERAQPVY